MARTKKETETPNVKTSPEGTTTAQETQEQDEDTAVAQERDLFAGIQNPCVYCGPTVRGVARQYTTYQGGIPDTLRSFIKEHPEARQFIVFTAQFPAYRRRLDTPGTAEAKLYKRTIILYVAEKDLGGVKPEQGTMLSMNDEEGGTFFHKYRVAESGTEMGMFRLKLEEVDE